MRRVIALLTLSLLMFPSNDLSARSQSISSTQSTAEETSGFTNRLIELLKKCQNFNRKISPRSVSDRKQVALKKAPLQIRKPTLSMISTKRTKPSKHSASRKTAQTTESPEKNDQPKGGWSLLEFLEKFRGPAPFARR